MKISDCKHLPEKLVGPRTDKCEGGEERWVSLRVCLTCGHVGCCDSSSGIHARKHAKETGHQVMASYPADKDSFIWCYIDNDYLEPDDKFNLPSKN